MTPSPSGSERRKARRRPVLDSFSLFLAIPKKGPHRLQILDISEQGIGFALDADGEAEADFPVKTGETLEIHLYMNQSLYLPLHVQVARIERKSAGRLVGTQFSDQNSKPFHAFQGFLKLLDDLIEVGQIAK